MGIKLEAIEGTDYTVRVWRDSTGGYDVEVYKPGHDDDPYEEEELVAVRYLEDNASAYELNRVVREVIEKDNPSLVGIYTGKESEEGEVNGS